MIPDGSVLIRDGIIQEVGPTRRVENLAEARDAIEINGAGRVVMPGFVDSHTHLLFPPAGSPDHVSAERAARASTAKRLQARAQGYLEAMARHGTTTVEAKTSGSPDENLEIKLLRVLNALKQAPLDLTPTVTCRLPSAEPEAALEQLFASLLPTVRRRRLARFVEIVWQDGGTEMYARFLRRAAEIGFLCRIHAESQDRDVALAMAAERGVAAIGYVGHANSHCVAAAAATETVVTLLPCGEFRSGGGMTSARLLIDSGVAVALATNFHPHHTPSLSMQTVISLACMGMGMTAAEAITAGTINGAYVLGCANRVGSIEPGKHADILMLNISDYRELGDHFGTNLTHLTLKRGACIYEEAEVAPRPAEALRLCWG